MKKNTLELYRRNSGPKTRELLENWEELERIIFIQGWTNEVLNKLA